MRPASSHWSRNFSLLSSKKHLIFIASKTKANLKKTQKKCNFMWPHEQDLSLYLRSFLWNIHNLPVERCSCSSPQYRGVWRDEINTSPLCWSKYLSLGLWSLNINNLQGSPVSGSPWCCLMFREGGGSLWSNALFAINNKSFSPNNHGFVIYVYFNISYMRTTSNIILT